MIEVISIVLIVPALIEQICIFGFQRFPYAYGLPIGNIRINSVDINSSNSIKERFSCIELRLASTKNFTYRKMPEPLEIFVREVYHRSYTGQLVLCGQVVSNGDLKMVIRANVFTIIFGWSLAAVVVTMPLPVILRCGVIAWFIGAQIASYVRFRKNISARLTAGNMD